MQLRTFITAMYKHFALWFHKRNIIIVSEHKVKHFHISGKLQFVVLALCVSCVCWASYSTGKFIATRSVLKEQSYALRSLTTERVEKSFSDAIPSKRLLPMSGKRGDQSVADASANLMLSPSAVDNIKLYARVAYLERKVNQLQETNETIVQRVREKTAGRMAEIENAISQTGLNVSDLKKEAGRNHPGGQGGPYIPAKLSSVPDAVDMFEELDNLELLQYIVGSLPTISPIHHADQQSPFGHRIDPITKHLAFHAGIDLSGPDGTQIHAPLGGKVISAGRNGAYGNAIDIKHAYGITTRYGHLSEIKVEEGQQIAKGDVIGIQGSTGRSTGPHLHYEVRYHNKPLNPKQFFHIGEYVSEE